MASKVFQSYRDDVQIYLDESVTTAADASRILAMMKALSESHRVLETVIIRAYNSSQALPLSADQKLSILFIVALLVYCFVIYPLFLCSTKDVPGLFMTSTAIGNLLHQHHKNQDTADQWALALHERYGAVVRLTPTLVSIDDSTLVPISKGTVSSSSTTQEVQPRESILFVPTLDDIVNDFKLAMKGQKTVDVHELLSRYLKERAPASFAIALAHTIYQLAHPMHRHYLNRLVREIQTADAGKVENLERLNAVVKESLRMQQAPNHHAHSFMTPKDGCKVGNYCLEERVEVTASLYCVSRSSSIFNRPNDFDPTRWLGAGKESGKMAEALDFVLDYHRRLKPDFDTTLEHSKTLLATLLRSFDMKLPLGEQPTQLDIVFLRSGGCRARFRERKAVVEKKVRFAEHAVM